MNPIALRLGIVATGIVWAAPAARVAAQSPRADDAQIADVKRTLTDVWRRATTRPFRAVHHREGRDPAGAVTEAATVRLTVDRPKMLWVREQEVPPAGPERPDAAEVNNTRYAFGLDRPRSGGEWILTDWKLAGEDKPSLKTAGLYIPELLPPFVHLTLNEKPLADLLGTPAFQVSRTEPSPDAAGCLRLHVEHTVEPKPRLVRRFQGWIDLDRAAGWCTRRRGGRQVMAIGNKTVSTDDVVTSYDYEVRDGVPVLTKIEVVGTRVTGNETAAPQHVHVTTTVRMEHAEAIPEAEFTLTAFGLPEPQGVVWDKPTPAYVWILIASAGCGLLALGFWWVSRRGVAPTVVPQLREHA